MRVRVATLSRVARPIGQLARLAGSRSRQAVTQWTPRSRSWFAAGVNLLFPPVCGFCQASIILADGHTQFCETCQRDFIDAGPACARCASSLPEQAAEADDCPLCRDHALHFQSAVRLGRYNGSLRAAVLRIKRPREQSLAMALGDLLAESRLEQLQALRLDVAMPIPMHWGRQLWRGMNNPEILAARLARLLRIPMVAHVLKRKHPTRQQTQLSPAERWENMRQAFRVATHRDLAGARVLVVDDVLTTGATGSEAAKALRKAGAEFVALAVLARGEGHR